MKNMEKMYLWVEKYRPNKMENMVLSEEYRIIFNKFLIEKEIPNLLLYGPPGSGKTAISRILIDNITPDKMDTLFLNGSSSTGIDIVRNHIEDFLKTPSFGNNNTKIVFIDEADYMSQNAQAALRNMFETYHSNGRFILTCNYLYKILEPIQSRCQSFEFRKVSKEYIDIFCEDILNKENIKFEKDALNKIISTLYPDIRKIVNTLQSRSEGGRLQIQNADIESKEKLVRSLISEIFLGILSDNSIVINQAINKLLNFLSKNEIDFKSVYQDLFYDDDIPIWSKIIINKYTNGHLEAMIPQIHFMAMIYSIIKMGHEIKMLKK